MAITRLNFGSSFTSLVKSDSFLAGNFAYSPSSYESIATVTVSGAPNAITFSSIPSTYTHLQLRGISAVGDTAVDVGYMSMQLNGDTGTNYSRHQLYGTTSIIYSYGAANLGLYVFGSAYRYVSSNSIVSPVVVDILDYANTNKYKTLRALSGTSSNTTGTSMVGMFSTVWRDTTAINSITIKTDAGTTLQNGTVYALYGIKG